jgi:DNA end-binding protein Ku
MGSKETILALIPMEEGILCQTLYYEEEIKRNPMPAVKGKVSDQELEMAKSLISAMIKPFAPEDYKNEYQERLRNLISDKIAGKETVSEDADNGGGNVIDLMDALSQSISQMSPKAAPKKKTRKKAVSAS